jgi:hypothetical protein
MWRQKNENSQPGTHLPSEPKAIVVPEATIVPPGLRVCPSTMNDPPGSSENCVPATLIATGVRIWARLTVAPLMTANDGLLPPWREMVLPLTVMTPPGT